MQLRDGSESSDTRLDRLVEFDDRSREYRARDHLLTTTRRRKSFRPGAQVLDQGDFGGCVGFSRVAALNASPHRRKPPLGYNDALERYFETQRNDQWAGGEYPDANPKMAGTSIIAGAREAKDRGDIESYYWIGAGSNRAIDDAVEVLDTISGIQLGTLWLRSMFRPRPSGLLEVDFDSGSAGGHAYYALTHRYMKLPGEGSTKRDVAAIWNTWGNWGNSFYKVPGFAYLALEDLERLLEADGEGCVLVERNAI